MVEAAADALAEGFALVVVVDGGAGIETTDAMACIALNVRRCGGAVRFVVDRCVESIVEFLGQEDVLPVRVNVAQPHPGQGASSR